MVTLLPLIMWTVALKKVKSSVTKEVEKAYENLGEQFTSAKGKQMKDEMPSYFG